MSKEKVLSKKAAKKSSPAVIKNTGSTILLDRKEFESTLSICRDFIAKRNTMYILSHIYLSTQEHGCIIRATDLEKTFSKVIAWKGNPVSFCLPLEIIYREVKALHSEITEVELTFKDKTVQVNGRCRIFTLPADEFPAYPAIDNLSGYDIPGMAEKLVKILPATGEGDTRYTLNGVLIDFEQGNLIGTDGHRLHISEFGAPDKDGKKYIVPKETAHLAAKYNASNTVEIGEKHILFSLAGGTMLSRLIEGTYPDYKKIIPEANPIKVQFQGAELLKVLEGALPLTTKANSIRMTINGQMEIETRNPDLGDYKWFIPCVTEGKTKDAVIGFNARYLIDAITAFTTKEDSGVTMEILDAVSPCLINHNAVVMPMRV